MGPFVPVAVSRLCRERRVALGMDGGGGVVAASYPFAFSRLCRETRSTLGNALMRGRGWIEDSNG